MTEEQNTTNNQTVQDITNQLDDLIEEAKGVNREIQETNASAKTNLDRIDADVTQSEQKLEQIFSDLIEIEKEEGDKLDALIIEEAENMASDDFA